MADRSAPWIQGSPHSDAKLTLGSVLSTHLGYTDNVHPITSVLQVRPLRGGEAVTAAGGGIPSSGGELSRRDSDDARDRDPDKGACVLRYDGLICSAELVGLDDGLQGGLSVCVVVREGRGPV